MDALTRHWRETFDPARQEWSRHMQQSLAPQVHACQHCWHSPRVWQGSLPVPRYCCWCAVGEQLAHGPYAEASR